MCEHEANMQHAENDTEASRTNAAFSYWLRLSAAAEQKKIYIMKIMSPSMWCKAQDRWEYIMIPHKTKQEIKHVHHNTQEK